MQRRYLLAAVGSGAAALLALAACAPGGQTQENQPTGSGDASSAASVDPASLGDITLTVWDQEVRGSQNDALEALNKQFQEKYPNIKINRVSQSNDDLQKQLALALSGKDVPDVAQVNNARGDMGQYVSAGTLTDLTPYAQVYGWNDRFSDSVTAKARYSSDGKTFGEGNLYGLPQTGEVVGIFYNKEKLAKLGVDVPKSWDDYFAALDEAKQAGEQPMVLGNLDKWPALHVFGPLQAHYVPADTITQLGMGNGGADWTSADNKQAMEQFAKWGADGYLGSSPNGVDYDAAWADFAKGSGVFLPAGSWLGTDIEAQMKDNVGFFILPGKGGQPETTGGTGIPFAIPAGSANKDAAAAYIDFITTDDAMKTIAEKGGMPVNKTAELAPASGVQHDIYSAFDSASTDGVLLPYLDYATPTFGDTSGQGLQEVLGKQRTPDEVLQAFQDDYSKQAK